jgi:LacI family transcriptional regulator
MLRNRQVDGLVVSTSQHEVEWLKAVYDSGTPLVLIDRHLGSGTLPAVVADNRSGGAMLAHHLVEQGYKKPLVLGLSTSHISSVAERIDGFLGVFKEHNLPCVVREVGFNTIQADVDKLLLNVRSLPFKPDCLFAVNNNIATAVLHSLAATNVKIPSDMAVVCFDDLPYFAFISPTITAIEQPVAQMCSRAFELLSQLMDGESFSSHEVLRLPVKLNVRQSSLKKSK